MGRLRLTFTLKFMLFASMLLGVFIASITLMSVMSERESVKAQVLENGVLFTEMSASFIMDLSEWNVGEFISEESASVGREVLADFSERNGDLSHVGRISPTGDVYFEFDGERISYPKTRIDAALLSEIKEPGVHTYERTQADGTPYYDIYVPIYGSGLAIQNIRTYDTDLGRLTGIINMRFTYSERVAEETRRILVTNLMIYTVFMALVLASSAVVGRKVARPVVRLRNSAMEIAKGNLKSRANVRSNDEIGDLAASFDQMAGMLEKSREKLESYSKDLEKKVAERTQELEKSKNVLQNTNVDLERFNKLAVGRELKMVELKKRIEELEKAKGPGAGKPPGGNR